MKTDVIINSLKDGIANLDTKVDQNEIGTVMSVADGIARISGLQNCKASEMLDFGNDTFGLALNLEEDSVGAVIFGDFTEIHEGTEVRRTGEVLAVPVSDNVIGRVVDPLVNAIDGKGKLPKGELELLEKVAPGVMDRQPVNVPLHTGIKAIDALTPIGRGQRQLIIGDRQTGKTTVAIDTILNQKGRNTKCIYVAIGQKLSKVTSLVQTLEEGGAMDYTTVVLAGASDSPAYLYLAPMTGVAIAEYFMRKGEDVLVVYDDLTKHAAAYRELSLLLRRPPGREAYPGDVFYLHSRLLERAVRMNSEKGGGSITALPIIETQADDVSAYIPTNVISITDGQIYLQSDLFNKGVRPAINVGLSVSRVGSAAQLKSTKKNAGKLKLQLAQFRELESFAQFASDLDEETKKQLERGKRGVEILKQGQYSPVGPAEQVVLFYALNNGYLDGIETEEIPEWQKALNTDLETKGKDLIEMILKGWDDKTEEATKEFVEAFVKSH